eukprot:TRINITY_DN2793_c0_g1_i1.p2 TRINITY_DN2793_c0_g1~~TRINITY_DN2793_c0_g1_i1.p2  ORF type:complete len:245 (-),score=32.51 TRINITY_DN2793_c0_g1_i1:361-1095(-)
MDKYGNEREQKANPSIRRTWTHKFLNKKYWHPQNPRNLEHKWLAEQQKQQEEIRNQQAAEELKAEKEVFDQIQQFDEQHKTTHAEKHRVAFLYMKPPGFQEKGESQKKEFDSKSEKEVEQSNVYKRRRISSQAPLLDGYIWSNKQILGDKNAPRGGFSPDDPNQQYLLPSKEEQEYEEEQQRLQLQLQEQEISGECNRVKHTKIELSQSEQQRLKKIVKREIKRRKKKEKSPEVSIQDVVSRSN